MRNRVFTLGCYLILVGATVAQVGDPKALNIGLVDSLVKELAAGRRELLDTEFPAMVKRFTGFGSRAVQGGDPFVAVKKLATGEWQFAVMPGVEFAWAKEKDPKLVPLLLAVNRSATIHAVLVGKKGNALEGFNDLKGKEVHILQGREHCRLFANKGAGGDAGKFFGKVTRMSSVEATLNDVLRDKVQAAVVDSAALEMFEELNPGRFKDLKVLAKSEAFPAITIAYYEGGVNAATIKRFREGMLKANDNDQGQNALANVNLTAFEAVPADYAKLLEGIRKAYPSQGK